MTNTSHGDTRTFTIGIKVAMWNDTQWTGVVTGVGYGEVAVRWDHQQDVAPWTDTRGLVII